jgi:hypothetical protein
MHYTASPASGGIQRMRALMQRMRVNSTSRVGIAFIVFDVLHDELAEIRARYPALYGPKGVLKVDVLHYGLDLAFWSSNWANKFTVATELRNVGKLYTKNGRTFYWGRGKNIGNRKYLHKGRPPVEVRGMYAEPFSDEQILASVAICRNLKKWMVKNTRFEMVNFMSHHLIHSTKWDAWPHYPFGRVKHAICYNKPFKLDGYISELDQLRCPPVKDEDSAEAFLVTMGYLAPDWMRYTNNPDADFKTAVKYFQQKKNQRKGGKRLKVDGKLNAATLKAMDATRRAYKLHLK